jgi:hypothetical protein
VVAGVVVEVVEAGVVVEVVEEVEVGVVVEVLEDVVDMVDVVEVDVEGVVVEVLLSKSSPSKSIGAFLRALLTRALACAAATSLAGAVNKLSSVSRRYTPFFICIIASLVQLTISSGAGSLLKKSAVWLSSSNTMLSSSVTSPVKIPALSTGQRSAFVGTSQITVEFASTQAPVSTSQVLRFTIGETKYFRSIVCAMPTLIK